MNNMDFILEQTKELLSIDSPTGFTKRAAEYVMDVYRQMGYSPVLTEKGGIFIDLGGRDEENAILLTAHMDTLGAMVHTLKPDGRLKLTPLGGLTPNNTEGENCRIYTRTGKIYDGTFQLINASLHVNDDYNKKSRTFDTMEVVVDEDVHDKAGLEALGIMAGDIVCFDPRTRITESGYIKSRFLDDKLSVGILMGYARHLQEEDIIPDRRIYQHIAVFEEVGHGNSHLPSRVSEVLSVDMGCVGEGLNCTERQVSICAKDSGGPYHYDIVSALIAAAQSHHIDFAVDIYPDYRSDVDACLTAGYDIRHGLIGAGVYASHGYERSHIDGVRNTFELLKAYLG